MKTLLGLLLCSMILLSHAAEDYYKILGVPRTADERTIKKAFKKLSLKYHPDKNKQNPDVAKEKFAKIVNAYEVLKDPKQREIYDAQGEEGLKQGGGGGGHHQNFQNFNFDDVFSSFFGGGGGFGGRAQGGGGGGGGQQRQQRQQRQEFNFGGDDFGFNFGNMFGGGGGGQRRGVNIIYIQCM